MQPPVSLVFHDVPFLYHSSFDFNPQRPCAAMVTVLALCVSLSVCLSVAALAATAFVSACNQRHLRHYFRLFLD